MNKHNVKLLKRNESVPVVQKAASDGPCTGGKVGCYIDFHVLL